MEIKKDAVKEQNGHGVMVTIETYDEALLNNGASARAMYDCDGYVLLAHGAEKTTIAAQGYVNRDALVDMLTSFKRDGMEIWYVIAEYVKKNYPDDIELIQELMERSVESTLGFERGELKKAAMRFDTDAIGTVMRLVLKNLKTADTGR